MGGAEELCLETGSFFFAVDAVTKPRLSFLAFFFLFFFFFGGMTDFERVSLPQLKLERRHVFTCKPSTALPHAGMFMLSSPCDCSSSACWVVGRRE